MISVSKSARSLSARGLLLSPVGSESLGIQREPQSHQPNRWRTYQGHQVLVQVPLPTGHQSTVPVEGKRNRQPSPPMSNGDSGQSLG